MRKVEFEKNFIKLFIIFLATLCTGNIFYDFVLCILHKVFLLNFLAFLGYDFQMELENLTENR